MCLLNLFKEFYFSCPFSESLGNVTPSFLSERCDGNRNIFHAVVNMCTPNSNKSSDNGKLNIHRHLGKICLQNLFSFKFEIGYSRE